MIHLPVQRLQINIEPGCSKKTIWYFLFYKSYALKDTIENFVTGITALVSFASVAPLYL